MRYNLFNSYSFAWIKF